MYYFFELILLLIMYKSRVFNKIYVTLQPLTA